MQKLEFTHDLPDREGYYWWTNFGEHTPTVLYVKRDYATKKFWASDEEFCFPVKKSKIEKDPELMVDGHYYGEGMWCYIPVPLMDGKVIKPSCY